MIKHLLTLTAVLAATIFSVPLALAQDTEPFSPAEREAIYTASIEKRATNILAELALTDSAKSTKVQAAIIAQYRALRARDEAIDAMLKTLNNAAAGVATNRLTIVRAVSKPQHDTFIAAMAMNLSPEQVEKVKDQMTYNKVKVTYDAYCAIVPGLSDKDKTRILDVLKKAREEAMDGGNADEKSAIFQNYKNQINAYLDAQGLDVTKATKEWEAKQELLQKQKAESGSSPK